MGNYCAPHTILLSKYMQTLQNSKVTIQPLQRSALSYTSRSQPPRKRNGMIINYYRYLHVRQSVNHLLATYGMYVGKRILSNMSSLQSLESDTSKNQNRTANLYTKTSSWYLKSLRDERCFNVLVELSSLLPLLIGSAQRHTEELSPGNA